ncbi:methyl-accepting chemotaxis protein [Catenovulum agarivorans DS-2]|uniref:Methyl-accepting chemotaxis protein n=1 Tax=Catenovulum agarivorans DS-2 TaxID=1328313 RepID=W7Q8S3_9ALTE|nr:methyl-accepting chemotaxis protein [Catenovulum agarivorans]EWH08411.1 methyl-accepting chemotaxis protein [Catenovulum agarivorans DS-2]
MLKKLKLLKSKLLMICAVPLIVIAFVLTWSIVNEMESFKQEQVKAERETLLAQKKNELKSLVLLGLSAMKETLQQPPSEQRDQAIVNFVYNFNFGEGTYFFINSYDMYAIANGRVGPRPPKKLNIDPSKHPGGKHPLHDMRDAAKRGGDFVQYTAFKKLGDKEQAPKLAYAQNIPGYEWLLGTGYFIDDIEVAVQKKINTFDMTLERLLSKTVIASATVLILSLVMSVVLIRKALQPLDNMNEALQDIAHGDGDLTHRLKVETDDEVGRCASSFNDFSEKIRRIVTIVSQEAATINNSTLSLDQSSQTSLNLVQEQRIKTEYLTQVIYEMVASAQEITNNGNKAAEAAHVANDESRKTAQALKDAVDKLQQLNLDINKSSHAMNELERETDSIGSVLQVIQQIAEQTNLLALNAAIEAARAGEQGRGFAVVADEVRTLASRTQNSTEEIKVMIEKLQTGAQNAVAAMEISKRSSVEAQEVAEASSHSLEKVNESIEVINEVNSVVATAASQQMSVTEDLNKNLHALCDLTGQTEDEVKSVAGTSQNLKDNATALNREMDNFTV